MTDKGEISELSKSRPRFAQVLWSSRRSAILGPATSKSLTLLRDSECSWIVSENFRTLKSRSDFSRIVTEFEALKSRSRSIKFVLRSSMLPSSDLCCRHWSVLIHLYGDDTVQVSILYKCSLLIKLSTFNWSSYVLSGLYVDVWVTWLTNLIESGYHQSTWLIKPFDQTVAARQMIRR
jgi:hypothetical protein